MSQPPGPPFPGPYGPPPYGPPPQGRPPYGPPAPIRPAPSGGRSPVPWLLAGGAVLLAVLGVLLVVLLTGDDPSEPARNQAAATSSAAPASEAGATGGPSTTPAEAPSSHTWPNGSPLEEPASAGGGQFLGSDEVALTWVQAMVDGDFQTAYDLSCADVQDSAAAIAAENGGDPAWELGTWFFEQTLGGVGFQDGTFDGIEHQPESGLDLARFTLDLDDGGQFPLLVYVGADLTVCDFL
jgi:hypothetical protein